MANILKEITAEEARKIADSVIERNKKELLESALYCIQNEAKKGKYTEKFNKSKITDYVKTNLIEKGFEVTKEGEGYIVSWGTKQEK